MDYGLKNGFIVNRRRLPDTTIRIYDQPYNNSVWAAAAAVSPLSLFRLQFSKANENYFNVFVWNCDKFTISH